MTTATMNPTDMSTEAFEIACVDADRQIEIEAAAALDSEYGKLRGLLGENAVQIDWLIFRLNNIRDDSWTRRVLADALSWEQSLLRMLDQIRPLPELN